MTKMIRTMRWFLMMTMAAASMANAQVGVKTLVAEPGLNLQVENVSMGAGGAQVKDDLFAGTEKFAKGASDVTEINLDPKMMTMLGSKNAVAGLAHKMNFIVIHTYTYDKPGMYKMEDVEAYRKKLEDGTWGCSIHVQDKDGTTDICSRVGSDHESTEMVILAAEPKELTFIHMSGHMSLDDLEKMGGAMGADSGGLKRR